MNKIYTINQISELDRIFELHDADFEKYKIILMKGDMGAGKTTLIKAYCAYKKNKDLAASPTFGLVHEYLLDSGNKIYHFDLYRVEDEEELYDIGFEEYLDSGNMCFIEWPGIAENFIPVKHILLNLQVEASGSRKVEISFTED